MRLLIPALLLLLTACAGPAVPDDGGTRLAVDGHDTLYVHGVGTGDPVLVVPGAAWLEGYLGPLPSWGRVVYCDLRGRGRSSIRRAPGEAGLAEDVADLERLREHLGLERFSLLAWSYDAAVALHYARTHPARVKRLFLVAPLPLRRSPHWQELEYRAAQLVSPPQLERLEELAARGAATRRSRPYHRALLEALIAGWGGDPGLLDSFDLRPFPAPHDDPDASAASRRELIAGLGEWDWSTELADLDVEVLVIHGERSSMPVEAARELAAALPHGRLLTLPRASHFPWLEEPTAFQLAVVPFPW